MKSKLPKGLERAEVVSLVKTRAEIGTGEVMRKDRRKASVFLNKKASRL